MSREPHPTDRRATLVSFTDHGAATADMLEKAHEEFADLLFAGMARQRFVCFTEGLDEVLERLKAGIAAAEKEAAHA